MKSIFWNHWPFWQAVLATFWGTVAFALVVFFCGRLLAMWLVWRGRQQSRALSDGVAANSRAENRPILILDYEIKSARRNPEQASRTMSLRNVGPVAALNATVDGIGCEHLAVRFNPVPVVAPGETKPVSYHVDGRSSVLGGDLVAVLDAVHAERRPHSLSGLFQVVPIPIAVEYEDANHNRYRTLSEIQFSGFYQGAVAVFVGTENVAQQSP